MNAIELTADELEILQKEQEDDQIFAQHSLELYEKHKGRYVTIVAGELFVGETFTEIEKQVGMKYPDRIPCIRFIPKERGVKLYVHLG